MGWHLTPFLTQRYALSPWKISFWTPYFLIWMLTQNYSATYPVWTKTTVLPVTPYFILQYYTLDVEQARSCVTYIYICIRQRWYISHVSAPSPCKTHTLIATCGVTPNTLLSVRLGAVAHNGSPCAHRNIIYNPILGIWSLTALSLSHTHGVSKGPCCFPLQWH